MVRFVRPHGLPVINPDVPELPGVYAMRNDDCEMLYIGMASNLRRRYGNWHSAVFTGRSTTASPKLQAALRNLDKTKWSFEVLVASENLSRLDLSRLERRAVRRAVEKGATLFNSRLLPS